MACPCGGKCGCGGSCGMGEAFPHIERVLNAYVHEKIATNQPFYISPDLNSDVLQMDGMGFFAAIAATVAKAATAIGTTVKAVAPTVIKGAEVAAAVNAAKGGGGSSGGSSGPSADDIAAAILPSVQAQLSAQGVQLPQGVAQKTVAAGVLDVFGPQNRNYVIAGALGILLILLLRR